MFGCSKNSNCYGRKPRIAGADTAARNAVDGSNSGKGDCEMEEVMNDKELIAALERRLAKCREVFVEYLQQNALLRRDAAEFEVDRLCGDEGEI